MRYCENKETVWSSLDIILRLPEEKPANTAMNRMSADERQSGNDHQATFKQDFETYLERSQASYYKTCRWKCKQGRGETKVYG